MVCRKTIQIATHGFPWHSNTAIQWNGRKLAFFFFRRGRFRILENMRFTFLKARQKVQGGNVKSEWRQERLLILKGAPCIPRQFRNFLH